MRRTILFFLCWPIWANAGTALTLAEAEALWQDHSRELRVARAVLGGAEADVLTAGQRPNPEVALNVLSISPWTGYGDGGWKDKKIDTQLRLEQLIERGGKRELRLKGAEARRSAAGLELEDVSRQQRGELRQAYYRLRLAQERLALARDTAALYGRSLEAGRLRQQAGDLAPIDVSRLQIDQARAAAEVSQATAELAQARQGLAYFIGRQADADALEAADDWPALEARAWDGLPLEQRPDLAAGRQRVAAAEAERDLARSRRNRDVTVGVQYERNQQNAPLNSYGFGLSVPLFLWHSHEGEIARADADYHLAREQYDQQQALAQGQVAQARHAVIAARERVERLQGGLLGDAQRVARAAELAYDKGAMGLLDLLDARRTLRQIQIEAATARADYARALADWQTQAEFRTTPQ